MARRSRLAFGLIIFGLLMSSATLAQPVAQTQNGPVTGTAADGVRAFLGMRYAAPPVGELRWQPPQPVPADLATHDATTPSPYCPQNATPYGVASTTEDCLYLNVYTPDRGDLHRLPVMVWIHGGALVVGGASGYDPSALVRQGGVIVVTINYRLGYLGFLAQGALDAEGHTSANYGLMDQQFALDWVARNIAGFGGNPRTVTIFGESAGGLSVLSQLASPTAHGLFQRVIVESGAYALNLPDINQAEARGDTFAAAIGCASDNAACLRGASVESILAQNLSGATPVVDGTVLPASLGAAFQSGQFNRVPVINGSNNDEGRLFVTAQANLTAADYPAAITAAYGATLTPELLRRYPAANYTQPVLALAAIGTDRTFACPGHLATGFLSQYVRVYAYEFADENAPELFQPPLGFPYGAAHASELQYLFSLPGVPYPAALSPDQQSLSRFMIGEWTDFASSGNPSVVGRAQRGVTRVDASTGSTFVPSWPTWTTNRPNVQTLAPPIPQSGSDQEFVQAHQCDFWEPLLVPPHSEGVEQQGNLKYD